MQGVDQIISHPVYDRVERNYEVLLDAAGGLLGFEDCAKVPREQFIRHLRRITQYPHENIKK